MLTDKHTKIMKHNMKHNMLLVHSREKSKAHIARQRPSYGFMPALTVKKNSTHQLQSIYVDTSLTKVADTDYSP